MPCFSEEVHDVFRKWGKDDLCKEIEAIHEELVKRRVDSIKYGDPDQIDDKARTKLNCKVLAQALLNRSERLLVSSGAMLLESSVYGLALIARGHLEGTAVLGYFCDRLNALSKGNITFGTFSLNVADAVMGAKHDLFDKANAPPNVLTSIEKADRFLNQTLFANVDKEKKLEDTYSWLSDFAHPNFLSHSAAFKLDKENHRMVFGHDNQLEERDFQLVAYPQCFSWQLFDLCFYDMWVYDGIVHIVYQCYGELKMPTTLFLVRFARRRRRPAKTAPASAYTRSARNRSTGTRPCRRRSSASSGSCRTTRNWPGRRP
jgi:hypothetical protein